MALRTFRCSLRIISVCDFLYAASLMGLSMYVSFSAALSARIILEAEMRSSSSSDVSNMFQRHLSFSESFIALSLSLEVDFYCVFSRNVSRSYIVFSVFDSLYAFRYALG